MKTALNYKIASILVALTAASSLGVTAQAASRSFPTSNRLDAQPQQTPTPESSVQAGATTSAEAPAEAPKDFIREAYLANEFGIAASQVALSAAKNPDAKAAAKTILADGIKVRSDLITAIQNATTDMHFDQSWSDDYKQKLAELKDAKGPQFDQKYLSIQGEVTNSATTAFGVYAQSGTDPSVKAFASNTLPVLHAEADKLDAAGQGGN